MTWRNEANEANETDCGRWVQGMLDKMTLREKIGQTIVQHVEHAFGRDLLQGIDQDRVADFLDRYPVGGLFIGGEVIHQAYGDTGMYANLVQLFQQHSRLPLLVTGDLEAGAGSAVSTLTRMPGMLALGAAADTELAYRFGQYTALEGRMAGFNWNLAPVADLDLNDANPLTGTRTAGNDPAAVGRVVAAVIRGMQEHGMAACAKHFPGDGIDCIDQHVMTSVNSLSEESWQEKYGAIYRSVIDAGVRTVMLGHIALPWLDPWDEEKHRHRPATVSGRIVNGLLREQLGFRGVTVTDALNMGGFTGWGDYRSRMIDCVNSGADLVLWPGPAYIDVIEEAIVQGQIQPERLEESVARILRMKREMGLIQESGQGQAPMESQAIPFQAQAPMESQATPLSDQAPMDSQTITLQARTLAEEIAGRSITLRRNRRNLLPLQSAEVNRVLVVKARTSSAHPVERHMDSVIGHLRSRGLEVTVVERFDGWDCLEGIRHLEEKGHRWDACLVLACARSQTFPFATRPEGECARALWAVENADTIQPVYISMLSPHLTKEVPYAETLVDCYSADSFTCSMLVKALFGEAAFNEHSPIA
ncbi:MAG: hypothetical protein K0R57_6338 [Paenibacillaceae bacterium]|nr:hypothetical protein [Paenibacillaceae bacterium]